MAERKQTDSHEHIDYKEVFPEGTPEERRGRWSNDLNEPGSVIHQIYEDLKEQEQGTKTPHE